MSTTPSIIQSTRRRLAILSLGNVISYETHNDGATLWRWAQGEPEPEAQTIGTEELATLEAAVDPETLRLELLRQSFAQP